MSKLTHSLALVFGLGLGFFIWGNAADEVGRVATESVSHKDVTTVTVVKPNGDKVVTKTDKSVVEKSKDVVTPEKNNYSLGAQAHVKNLREQPSYSIEVGKRLTGDLWGTGSYNPTDKSIGLGLRIEF